MRKGPELNPPARLHPIKSSYANLAQLALRSKRHVRSEARKHLSVQIGSFQFCEFHRQRMKINSASQVREEMKSNLNLAVGECSHLGALEFIHSKNGHSKHLIFVCAIERDVSNVNRFDKNSISVRHRRKKQHKNQKKDVKRSGRLEMC